MIQERTAIQLRPTAAFVGASWVVLGAGIAAFLIGLWNATLQLNEKGFYFAILLFGLFSAVSLQKTVRDRIEGLPVTNIYYGLCWTACIAAVVLLTVGLWNANLLLSEKGFYAISFLLANFAVITVQKNVRDLQVLGPAEPETSAENATP